MKISKEKRDKISEQILILLFSNNSKPLFTSHIAMETARDEEFIKKLLLELKKNKLVIEIKKNSKGNVYLRRSRWILTNEAYKIYKNHQQSQNLSNLNIS